MTTYLALLRGINVAGKNKVPMKGLRAVLEELGYEDVRTYVQSGNVVFESGSRSAKKLASAIEDAMSRSFDLDVSVMIRTRREFERVVGDSPFTVETTKPSFLHVMFMDRAAPSRAVETLDHDRSPPDEFEVKGREVYLLFPNGAGRSKLTNDYFEKKLEVRSTARNWNTITKLLEMMAEGGGDR